MTKKQKEKLAKYAVKMAESVGFQKQSGKWHDYHKKTPAGLLELTVRSNTDIRTSGICCFMIFENPSNARLAGYSCNPYSGKYNYHGLETKEQIESIFQQFN